jgi:hypothetical protein
MKVVKEYCAHNHIDVATFTTLNTIIITKMWNQYTKAVDRQYSICKNPIPLKGHLKQETT